MRPQLGVPRCALLDVAAIVLPVWLLILVCHTAADADLWGHLRFGTDLLAGSGLPSADPYSFTSDVPWINHEWLSEVIMALVFNTAGVLGLNLLKIAVIAGVGLMVWRAAHDANASHRSAALLTTLVLFASYTRTQVLRPQLFSVLIFAVLLDVLRRGDIDSRRWWLREPAVFCLWANVHGGWIVGFAVLCVWRAVEALERRTTKTTVRAAVLVALAGAATALNPYGVSQWRFLSETVGLSRRDISDWTPFLALPTGLIVLNLILPVIASGSLALSRNPLGRRELGTVSVLAFGTFLVGRVDAFLQIAIGILLAPAIVEYFNRFDERLSGFERLSRITAVNAVSVAAVVSVAFGAVTPRLTHIVVEGPWIPDREAVRYLRAEAARTRLLTWFDWGEYAIWHLSPGGVQVSMDGRRETVYSAAVLADHWAFYRNDPDAWRYPDRIGAERIWLPRELPVVSTLRQHGWHIAFESERSIVLSRESSRTLVASRDRSPQYFPAE